MPAISIEARVPPQGLTRYGLKLRLQCGVPRLGHDKGMRESGWLNANARKPEHPLGVRANKDTNARPGPQIRVGLFLFGYFLFEPAKRK